MDMKKELQSLNNKTPGYIKILRTHEKSSNSLPKNYYKSGFNTLEAKIEKMLKDVEDREAEAKLSKSNKVFPAYNEEEYWKVVLEFAKEIDDTYDEETSEIKSNKKYICVNYEVYNIIETACPGCQKTMESYGLGRLGRLISKKDFQSVLNKIRVKYVSCNILTSMIEKELLFITHIDVSFGHLRVKESDYTKESLQASLEEFKKNSKIKKYDEKGRLIES